MSSFSADSSVVSGGLYLEVVRSEVHPIHQGGDDAERTGHVGELLWVLHVLVAEPY